MEKWRVKEWKVDEWSAKDDEKASNEIGRYKLRPRSADMDGAAPIL